MKTSNYYKFTLDSLEFFCSYIFEFLVTKEFLKYIISMFCVLILVRKIRGELENQWHVKVSVLGIKLKNQWAQEDMPLVRSVVKSVKSF
jgi:hypothetical protein